MFCLVGRFFITKYKFFRPFNTHSKHLCCKEWTNIMNKTFIRRISLESNINKEPYIPFLNMINNRQAEAKKSVIVQVQSEKSFQELYQFCGTIGEVKMMHHYTVGADKSHFIIVEFTEEAAVNEILLNSSHLEDSQAIPMHSNFLWFRLSGRKVKLKNIQNLKLSSENGNEAMGKSELIEILRNCENITDQIWAVYNATTLNDVASRLRFLTARQIELSLTGIFPKVVAYPFGSSVNGFGKMGCDLDTVLRLGGEVLKQDSRLVFHCKAVNGYERAITQRHMEMIGDLLQLFLPGCSQIRKILQARVPIIKYYQQMTDVECDLSMNNMSGVWMSDMLYLFGSIDPRVRPLVFTIRKWAQEIGLTNSSPGRWITNFSLTLLVLAYLQKPNNSPPILPSFNELVKRAETNDKYITEDGVNCTFLRNLNKLDFKTKNTDSLEQLLNQFCEYYCNFDFTKKAVCLNEAIVITKPDHSPMYIVNPLERGLNVSKNVSLEELEKFKLELRNAAWILESQNRSNTNWGILSIFDSSSTKKSFILPNKARLMDVSQIFNEDDGNVKAIELESKNTIKKRKSR